VDNWNNVEFGYSADYRQYYHFNTFKIEEDDCEGTISYETRELLWKFKHELRGEPIILPPKRSFMYKLFNKDVVNLS
jgi:hypothetical protein